MFSKVALFTAASMAILIAATPLPQGGVAQGSCNTGPIQCCDQFTQTDSTSGTSLLNYLGINAQDVTGNIGTQCTPLSIIGVGGGTNCGSTPVCCENNSFNGLVAIGCSPINVNV